MDGKVLRQCRLDDVLAGDERAKAEAVTFLDETDKEARILVLYDGIENGGAREYRFPMPE
jgi:hypothetical protein